MPYITTQAIVLHTADYRENDRMLSLLSPEHGKLDALCRGCKKPQSPLMSAAQPFSYGEYVLYQSKGRMTVTSFNLIDSFYPLREDYERLRYAACMLEIMQLQALPGEGSPKLFLLLARSLKRLCYMPLEPRAVTAAFLLMDAALSGWRPQLDVCVHCGKPIPAGEPAFFDIDGGGLRHRDCVDGNTPVLPLTAGQTAWLRDVMRNGVEKTEMPARDAPLLPLLHYLEDRLDTRIKAAKGLR